MSTFVPEGEEVIIAGYRLVCNVCRHDQFRARRAKVTGPIASFFDVEWASPTADCFVCARCGHVHWFLPAPKSPAPARDAEANRDAGSEWREPDPARQERDMSRVSVRERKDGSRALFAAVDFDVDDVVLEFDDWQEVEQGAQVPARDDNGKIDILARGRAVRLVYPERHLRHSCDPNAYVKTVDGVRYLIARRPIPADGEITRDERINSAVDEEVPCACGASRCFRRINRSFFQLPSVLMREYLPLLDDWFIEEHKDQIERIRRL